MGDQFIILYFFTADHHKNFDKLVRVLTLSGLRRFA
jgi:hypothetical protein